MGTNIRSYRELRVYKLAFSLAIEIFNLSKRFPAEERFSLSDQIRRSSRSVCANLGEAWRKRRYRAAFISKLNDAEGEATETQVWLEFALQCNYIDTATFDRLDDQCDHIQAQLVKMVDQVEDWTLPSSSITSSRGNAATVKHAAKASGLETP